MSRIACSGAYQPERSYLARCRAGTHAHVHATARRHTLLACPRLSFSASLSPFFFSFLLPPPRCRSAEGTRALPGDHRLEWRNFKEKSKSIGDRPRKLFYDNRFPTPDTSRRSLDGRNGLLRFYEGKRKSHRLNKSAGIAEKGMREAARAVFSVGFSTGFSRGS